MSLFSNCARSTRFSFRIILLVFAFGLAPFVSITQPHPNPLQKKLLQAQALLQTDSAYSVAYRIVADLRYQLEGATPQDIPLHLQFDIYKTYIDISNKMINATMNPEEKRVAFRIKHRFYEKGIDLAYQLFYQTKHQGYLQFAFGVAEYNRNFHLLNTIHHSEAVSDETKSALGKCLSQINTLKNKVAIAIEKNDLEKVQQLENQRDSLIHFYNSEMRYLRENAPLFATYNNLGISANLLDSVQTNLKPKELLIEYFAGEEAVYVFVIGCKKSMFLKLPEGNKLTGQVHDFHENLHRYEEKFTAASHELYRTAFKPLESFIKNETNIILISDGLIGAIPFEALSKTSLKKWDRDFKTLHYLIQDFQFTFQHSAQIWLREKEHTTNIKNPSILGLAPIFEGSLQQHFAQFGIDSAYQQLNTLPNTEYFLDALKRDFKGSFFYKEKATTATFLSNHAPHQILQFATHTIIDNDSPSDSKIVLSKTIESSKIIHDGYFSLKDIYGISPRLKASLAILEGCQTGTGQFINGEGISGLAYAFSFAGVPNVIYTIWSVDEVASNQILLTFYQNLKEGADAATALRFAKLNYLEKADELRADPFYWAGLKYTGNDLKFEFSEGYQGEDKKVFLIRYSLIGVTGIVLIFLGLLFFKKRKMGSD